MGEKEREEREGRNGEREREKKRKEWRKKGRKRRIESKERKEDTTTLAGSDWFSPWILMTLGNITHITRDHLCECVLFPISSWKAEASIDSLPYSACLARCPRQSSSDKVRLRNVSCSPMRLANTNSGPGIACPVLMRSIKDVSPGCPGWSQRGVFPELEPGLSSRTTEWNSSLRKLSETAWWFSGWHFVNYKVVKK